MWKDYLVFYKSKSYLIFCKSIGIHNKPSPRVSTYTVWPLGPVQPINRFELYMVR